jgi:molybdopterin-containing oxidoreductase family iron-sulfur binding subunit
MTSRREFLKAASLTLGGVGVGLAGLRLARAEEHEIEVAASTLRWAMVVDLPRWIDLQDHEQVFQVCHRAHNVPDFSGLADPEERIRHAIKWIWDEPFANAFPGQHHEVMTERYREAAAPVLCNHCESPSCVRVCPTQATWKRDDGIVMMDMHRCIGCRYCIIACPYGSRSFNFRDPVQGLDPGSITPSYPRRMRGVVEKCTFCSELSDGSGGAWEPECVRASQGALSFGNLRDPRSEVRRLLSERFSIRRKPDLGTNPYVFYLI